MEHTKTIKKPERLQNKYIISKVKVRIIITSYTQR